MPRILSAPCRRLLAAALLLVAAAPAARAQYTFVNVADTSSPIHGGFGGPTPSLNSAGTLGFCAFLDAGGQEIYADNGTTTKTIALRGLTYDGFVSNVSIDTAGKVAFNAGFQAGGRALLIGDGTTTTQVLHTGDALFGSTVIAFAVGRDALNDAGQLGS